MHFFRVTLLFKWHQRRGYLRTETTITAMMPPSEKKMKTVSRLSTQGSQEVAAFNVDQIIECYGREAAPRSSFSMSTSVPDSFFSVTLGIGSLFWLQLCKTLHRNFTFDCSVL